MLYERDGCYFHRFGPITAVDPIVVNMQGGHFGPDHDEGPEGLPSLVTRFRGTHHSTASSQQYFGNRVAALLDSIGLFPTTAASMESAWAARPPWMWSRDKLHRGGPTCLVTLTHSLTHSVHGTQDGAVLPVTFPLPGNGALHGGTGPSPARPSRSHPLPTRIEVPLRIQ